MAGEDLNGGSLSRVGSFIADGAGKITGALEDVSDEVTGLQTVTFSGGTYSIDANGHGSLQFFSQGTTVVLKFSIVLSSTSNGLLVQTDLNATSSGNFTLASAATPAVFSLGQISGNYVFDVAGIRSLQTGDVGLSIIGQLKTNGGNVSGGLLDVNDGVSGPSGAVPILNGTSYQLDPANGNGANFGRGTLSFAAGTRTFNFVFYIVDATHFKVLETDTDAGLLTSGDAVLQGTVPTQSSGFTGSFAFLVGGSDTSGPLAEVGRFTSDTSQNLNNVFVDLNDAGVIPNTISNPATPTYQFDPANAGSGRGTLTFTDATIGQFTFVFYLSSQGQGVIQDTSGGVVADGSLLAQTGGPFTAASVAGSYAVNITGINLGSPNNATFEEDFLGQYVLPLPSGQQHNGALDIVELGSSGKNFIPQDPISIVLNISGDGTQSNPQYDFQTANAPAANIKCKAYFVNQQQVFLLGNTTTSVDLGIATQQH
jgi:hypothetical protein